MHDEQCRKPREQPATRCFIAIARYIHSLSKSCISGGWFVSGVFRAEYRKLLYISSSGCSRYFGLLGMQCSEG